MPEVWKERFKWMKQSMKGSMSKRILHLPGKKPAKEQNNSRNLSPHLNHCETAPQLRQRVEEIPAFPVWESQNFLNTCKFQTSRAAIV